MKRIVSLVGNAASKALESVVFAFGYVYYRTWGHPRLKGTRETLTLIIAGFLLIIYVIGGVIYGKITRKEVIWGD